MTKRQEPWPTCSTPGCRSVVSRDPATDRGPAPDGLCQGHRRLSADIAALPDKEVHNTDEAVVPEEPAVPVPIDSLRDALRGAIRTTEVSDLINAMLLDALRASKKVWHDCPHCRRRSTVALPDLATRVGAITKLLEAAGERLKDSVEEEWSVERRAIEDRQRALRKVAGAALDEEINRLSAQLGVEPGSRTSPKYDGFSTEDLSRFALRLEKETK